MIHHGGQDQHDRVLLRIFMAHLLRHRRALKLARGGLTDDDRFRFETR